MMPRSVGSDTAHQLPGIVWMPDGQLVTSKPHAAEVSVDRLAGLQVAPSEMALHAPAQHMDLRTDRRSQLLVRGGELSDSLLEVVQKSSTEAGRAQMEQLQRRILASHKKCIALLGKLPAKVIHVHAQLCSSTL